MNILITGSAGFIGYNLHKFFLSNPIKKNQKIVGLDSLNNYYDVKLKQNRTYSLKKKFKNNYIFIKEDFCNYKKLKSIFKKYKFSHVIHLGALAGVRNSILNPRDYLKNNVEGFFNILECCKIYKIKNLICASTSSVYGNAKKMPIKETASTDYPIQFYAATKKANEVFAHSYSELYSINTTILRFFTVYGPWGRPDMALFKFTENIIKNKYINLFNYGNHTRTFSYIDDVISSINLIFKKFHLKDTVKKKYRILNVSSNNKTTLKQYVNLIEKTLKKKSKKKFLKLQKGDINKSYASVALLKKLKMLKNVTSVETGIQNFVSWYLDYRKINLKK